MKHRAGTNGSTNIYPGQPGWRDYLGAFKVGPERNAERKKGFDALKAQQEKTAATSTPPSSQSGLGGGPNQ